MPTSEAVGQTCLRHTGERAQGGRGLCMDETDWQLGNSGFTTESSHLLGGYRYLTWLRGMLDSHLPY